MTGTPTQTALGAPPTVLTPSRQTTHSGPTPTTTATATIPLRRPRAMDVQALTAIQTKTAMDAPIPMATVIPTPTAGGPPPMEQTLLFPMPHNGPMAMLTGTGTTHQGTTPMPVQHNMEPPLKWAAWDVQIAIATVMPTWMIPSRTKPHNGRMLTVMATATRPLDSKRMHAQAPWVRQVEIVRLPRHR